MNDGFTKLYSNIITSSVWSAAKETKILWITMLALTDANGYVTGSVPGLAATARLTVLETEAALSELLSPDKYSRSIENEGRRLEKVEGGWIILNYAKHRKRGRAVDRRAYLREYMREYRKQKSTEGLQGLTLSASASVSTHKEGGVGEEINPFPVPVSLTRLATPQFTAAWADFVKHRQTGKRHLTVLAADRLLARCNRMGSSAAVEAISRSIENGWYGIFEPDNRRKPTVHHGSNI